MSKLQTLLDTGLLSAAADGDTAEAKRLLDLGAQADARTEWGAPAIVLAAEGGHGDIVHELIGRGADVDARRPGAETALMIATVHGHLPIVTALLEAGADTSPVNHWGKTALHQAAVYDQPEIAREILAAGADMNVKDSDGLTFKDLAKKKRQALFLAVIEEAEETRFQNDLKGYNKGLDREVKVTAPVRIRSKRGPRISGP